MSILFALALSATPAPIFPKKRCVHPKSQDDIGMCQWLHMMGLEELRTAESVGVGAGDDIETLRSIGKNCGLTYRVDYVGSRVAVVVVFNADEKGRSCFLSWVRSNAPNLEFSEARLDKLVQAPEVAQ